MTARRTIPDRIGASLQTLASDRRSGATDLSRRLFDLLEQSLRPNVTTAWSGRDLLRLSRGVRSAQPAMGAFQRWADRLEHTARSRSLPATVRRLMAQLHGERRALRFEVVRASEVAAARLPRGAHVLTLSHSATVERTLIRANQQKRVCEVTMLESRPGGEGRVLARRLRARGVPSVVVPDRAGPRAAREASVVLIGADSVYADGSVVHKVGTRKVVLAAWNAGVPVGVVSGRSKWVPRPRAPRSLPPLFDLTPASAIRAWWTDRGPWRPRRRTGRATH